MTLHADARRLLTDWEPPDAEQAELRSDYLDHLDAHHDALLRSCHPDHLTASVLVCSADASRVLLTLHARLGRWLQTGGHCEAADATLAGAAGREGREESGIADLVVDPVPVLLSRHEVPCGPLRPAHHLDVQFVAVAPAGAVPVRSDESADLAWFDPSVLPGDADDSVRDLVRHGVARVRSTLDATGLTDGRQEPAADQPSR